MLLWVFNRFSMLFNVYGSLKDAVYICIDILLQTMNIMKESIISFFQAPITNKVPACQCNIIGLHTYITSDKNLERLTHEVRATLHDATLFRQKKQQLLPYVTPAGIFTYCKEICLTIPSGLFVIDIDHLDSTAEAEKWRDRLFADDVLRPDLAFISPGAKGVKLFIPYRISPHESVRHSFDQAMHAAWDYIGWKHGLKVAQ